MHKRQLLPPTNKVCEGYVFTYVCLSTGPCRWYPSMPCRSPGGVYPSMPCRFPGPHRGGSLRGLAREGLQAHTQGEVEGSGQRGLQGHIGGVSRATPEGGVTCMTCFHETLISSSGFRLIMIQ